eukprot:scaffold787_cov63-Phaeocystis_antarctica.AAC.1
MNHVMFFTRGKPLRNTQATGLARFSGTREAGEPGGGVCLCGVTRVKTPVHVGSGRLARARVCEPRLYRLSLFLRTMFRGIYCTHWRHHPLHTSLHQVMEPAPRPVGTCHPSSPHPTRHRFTPPRSARSRPPPPPRASATMPRLPR